QIAYGLVNWVSKGLFIGERHVYLGAQVDDVFIDDDIWYPTRPCGSTVDNTGQTYRINSTDVAAVIRWQNAKRAVPISADFRLDLAFNGVGTVVGEYPNDTLTPYMRTNQSQFKWINHTYDHENLNGVTYDFARSELTQNIAIATSLKLARFSAANL